MVSDLMANYSLSTKKHKRAEQSAFYQLLFHFSGHDSKNRASSSDDDDDDDDDDQEEGNEPHFVIGGK